MKKRFWKVLLVVLLVCHQLAPLASVFAEVDLPFEWTKQEGVESQDDELVRIIVQLENSDYSDSVKQRVAQLQDSEIRKQYDVIFDGFSATVQRRHIDQIRLLPGVVAVTEAKVYKPLMASSALLTQSLQAAQKYANNGEGMVVSIIDSGIDTSHKDLQTLNNPEKAKIKEPFNDPNVQTDTVFTMKVPYGYNFADDSYFVKGTESDHGVHVAGIVGANAPDDEVNQYKGIDGVASEVQLLAMGVFSNDPKKGSGAYDDDIAAAIEASIEHGADVINMSLGSESGYHSPNDPVHRAINVAEANGVLVVVAAGNDQAAFTSNGTSPQTINLTGRDDMGLVGSPSTADGALSVASYQNSHELINQFTYKQNGADVLVRYRLQQGEPDGVERPVVFRGYGQSGDYQENEDLSGKIVLLERGRITFAEKVKWAHEHQAAGVIIYNNEAAPIANFILTGAPVLFTVGLNQAEGRALRAAVEADPQLTVTFPKDQFLVPSEDGHDMSGFSSWGTTNTLDFKPEISGVGGAVYSTTNDGEYTVKSGTSMAAPHVAGAGAIVFSQLRKDLPNLPNHAVFTKKTMMNTTKVLVDKFSAEGYPYSPRRQGAGLLQTDDAIRNRVLATFETVDGEAVGELREFTGTKTFNVVLKNYGDQVVTFTVAPGSVYSTAVVEKMVVGIASPAHLRASQNRVTLAPGDERTVQFTLDASQVTNDFVEGFIRFNSTNEATQPSLTFAYMGYAGDWNAETAFDVIDVKENEGKNLYRDTRLVTTFRARQADGTVANQFVPVGGVIVNRQMSNTKPSLANYTFSPNADGAADTVTPQIGILRNLSHVRFNVLDSNKQHLRHLGQNNEVDRLTIERYLRNVLLMQQFVTRRFDVGTWDGKLYDPALGQMVMAPEGLYHIQALGQLTPDSPAQELVFPIRIDLTPPTITVKETDGKPYTTTAEGKVFTFEATDTYGVNVVYAAVGTQRYDATRQEDGTYQVVVPYSTATEETVVLYAYDFAYNETRETIGGIRANTLQIGNWQQLIDTPLSQSGRTVFGRTANANTRYINFELKNSTTDEVVQTKQRPVRNGRIIADVQLTPAQQGRYLVTAIEYDEQKTAIQKTELGEFYYDTTKPLLSFDNATALQPADFLFPQPANPEHTEYQLTLNGNGTATVSGIARDNVFTAGELLLSHTVYGQNPVNVTVDATGKFSHTFTRPAQGNYDVMTIAQPSVNKETGMLDAKKAGLKYDYLFTKYVAPAPAAPAAPADEKLTPTTLNINYLAVLGASDVSENPNDVRAVVVRDGKYYYKVSGTIDNVNSTVEVEGEKVELTPQSNDAGQTVGLSFQHEIEIVEGTNAVNVRVYDKNGKREIDTKVRVLFDVKNPTLLLTSPGESSFTRVSLEEGGALAPDGSNNLTYLDTSEDVVEFAGTISDNGYGYLLSINDEPVAQSSNFIPGDSTHGDNTQAFSKKIRVADGDIIKLSVLDENGNGETVYYVVRKVEAPAYQPVVLRQVITKLLNEPVYANDFVIENPEQYPVQLVSPIDTTTAGEKQGQLRVIYDADNIETVNVTVNVVDPSQPAPHNVDQQQDTADANDVPADELTTKLSAVHNIALTGRKVILNDAVTVVSEHIVDDTAIIPEALKQYARTTYDIRVLQDNQSVSELEEKVTVTVPLDGRQFVGVFHIHDGQIEQLEHTVNEAGTAVSFETSRFSPFILAYQPVETPQVSQPAGPTGVERDKPLVKLPQAPVTQTDGTNTAGTQQTQGTQQAPAAQQKQGAQQKNLPATNEQETTVFVVIAVMALVAAVYLLKRKKQ